MRQFGKYRLMEPLATGGMAEVWRAEVTGAEGVVKDVAVKLIRGGHEADGAFVQMFVQEARLAARLGHANIVQVFEFDEIDGRYYIAMELVRGHHLGHVVERARVRGLRIGVPRAVQIGTDVARALAYAHRLADGGRPLGLVHRDVSPHNVLVSFEGEVKLADFGIARAMNLAEATAPGTVKGKSAYMAPEQARGDAVDARADVFALGVVLWELCAGRRLFARESEVATLAALLAPEPVSPPSAWNEDVPPDLDALISATLEKDPERRIRSAQELATALATVLFRVTRSPEDVDLRGLMQGLFPEEAVPAPAHAEPTSVRHVGIAAEPVELATADRTKRESTSEESATLTALTRPERRSGMRRVLVAGGGVLTAAIAAALLAQRTCVAVRLPDGAMAAPRGAPAEPDGPSAREPPETASSALIPPTEGHSRQHRPDPESRNAGDEVLRANPPAVIAHSVGGSVPKVSSGEGVLSVSSTPWGRVSVDGHDLCDAPCTIRLRAGRHTVVVRNAKSGLSARHDVSVTAGVRTSLLPTLR